MRMKHTGTSPIKREGLRTLFFYKYKYKKTDRITMSRLTGKGAGSLANAYASIYEGYGKKKEEKKGEDCTAASEKTTHNCAKKVCHEQFGEGTCVHGQHSFPDENGFVSHYDVEFSHGIEKAVPVSEMKVLEEGSHNEEAHEGMYDGEQLDERISPQAQAAAARQRRADAAAIKATEVAAGGGQAGIDNALKQRYGGRMPSERQLARHSSGASASRSVAATGRENLYRGGGGDAAVAKGLTRQQVMAQGVKNFKAKQAAPAPSKPVQPAKPAQPAKPQLSAQDQATNKEYDRLRSQPGGAAAAKEFGMKASQAKFGADFAKPKTQNPLLTPKPSSGGPSDASKGDDSIAAMIKRSKERQAQNQDVDLFDLVKGHLIDEGASEEEAMKKMVSMTQEEILALAEGYDEPKMHAAVKRVMTTQPAAKGRAASRLHTKYSMRSKGLTAGETDGPGPNAPKRSGRKGRGSETDRGSGNAAKRRMDK